MKPVVLAKHYCANYMNDGTCNGVDFKGPKWVPFRFLPEGTRCLIACGYRCRYFETAVMPMKDGDYFKSNLEAKEFKDGIDQYFRRHIPGLRRRQKKCLDCGAPIGPHKRLCIDCAEKRNRVNNAKYQAEWREKQAGNEPK